MAAAGAGHLASPLLGHPSPSPSRRRRPLASLAITVALLFVAGAVALSFAGGGGARLGGSEGPDAVTSEVGAVAADDGRCSAAGAAVLRAGGHAVDAAVAAALCLGVVHPVSSGIGGGAFIVVRAAAGGETVAFDARETAPAAATQNMYDENPASKHRGALAMGIPGELAGLHAAWSRYGRLPWKDLFRPAIRLARDGYTILPYVGNVLRSVETDVLADPGLRRIFAPGGRLLQANETCRNLALADALEAVANEGIQAFYNGSIGEAFVGDVRGAGGIAAMDDLRGYKVEVQEAMRVDAMGHTILGMPLPSSGTVGMSLVLNVLAGYKSLEYLKGFLGVHRLVEALKHMFAERMGLGDPNFVNVTGCVADMLSPSFADEIRRRILDNTTFPPGYYFPRWSELRDHGTSHLCVVDGDRNAMAMTSTVNSYFGAKVLSLSTGIVLNNEMDDFSVPTEETTDHLPPAPANFIAPGKRPLSSMTPIIVLKDGQLAGVLGGSGGMNIIPAVTQVFLNHFIVGMRPLAAVQHPRVYHKLIPNVVLYENSTAIDGEVIEFDAQAKAFLEQRGHRLQSTASGAACQLIAQDLLEPVPGKNIARSMKLLGGGGGGGVFHGVLTAVSDPRKDGSPAGL